MNQRYGPLQLDVPAELVDETLVVLRAPVPPPAVRMRVAARESLRPSFVIKRVPVVGDAAPALEDVGAAEERMLAATLDGFSVLARDVRTLAGRPTLVVEVSFDAPDGKLRQVHVTFVVEHTVLVFVATALDDASFSAVRDQLLAMAATAQLH